DYDEQISRIQKQSLLVNMIAGGLMSPSDSVLGIATSTVSPAVSHEIGQYFKGLAEENKRQGITEEAELTASQKTAHIAAHAILGAVTANANGGNALSGALSAGGAEAIAPVISSMLYKETNPENLTAEQKETISAVTQALGTLSGSVTGDSSLDAYVGGTVATNAVENNWQVNQSVRPTEKDIALHTRKYSVLERIMPAHMLGYATDEETKTQLMFLSGVRNAETGAVAVALSPYAIQPVTWEYAKVATDSVAIDAFVTTTLENQPYTVNNLKYSLSGAILTGGLYKAGANSMITGSKITALPNGVVSKIPATKEAQVVQKVFETSTKAKAEGISYLTDKAITSQTNQNDNSKVLIKKRSDWFGK
ncbi:MAG: VENN motif pre-toxin domain-containing protein, partial [Neisseriaceae bacterium]|nr:VENN motif pre-toxin domain-containing protein [Neisseriaceae bacterium]